MSKNKELRDSTIKVLLSSINVPIIGPALSELFDFRSKVKQNRLNQFTELLENFFSNHVGIGLENFQTEEFGDLFESVLRRVVQTKSKEKHRRFRDVLINHIVEPSQNFEDSEIYLELISSLSESEIKILDEYRNVFKDLPTIYDDLIGLSNCLDNENIDEVRNNPEKSVLKQSDSFDEYITNLTGKYNLPNSSLRKMLLIRESDYFYIPNDQFLFYKQRLFSKGLIVDYGTGAIGTEPFKMMSITEFGIKFIDFIRSK